MKTILQSPKSLQKLEFEEGGEFREMQVSINLVLHWSLLLCRGKKGKVEPTEKQ